MNREKLLEAIVEIAPGMIGNRWDHTVGACIASTATGLLVCKHFAIEAEPVSVELLIGNAKFAKRLDEGWPKFASEEEALASGCQYLLIDSDNKGPGFSGHLVIALRSSNDLLDLSMAQFKRPHKQIIPPDGGCFRVTKDFWGGGLECRYTLPGGETVLLKLQLNPPDWPKSPDWQRTHDQREVAKKIIKKVERLMKEATNGQAT